MEFRQLDIQKEHIRPPSSQSERLDLLCMAHIACHLLPLVSCLARDGRDMFLWNAGLSPNYAALQAQSMHSSLIYMSTVIWMAILCPMGQVKLFTWIRQFYNGIPLCEKIIKEGSEKNPLMVTGLGFVCLLFWPVISYNEDKSLKSGMSTITVLHKLKWQYSKSRGVWLRLCY